MKDGFYQHGYIAHSQTDCKPAHFKDVCFIDALRRLGCRLRYTRDGPFQAFADGNVLLEPLGRRLRRVDTNEMAHTGKFLIHTGNHFLAVRVHEECLEVFDGPNVEELPRNAWESFASSGFSCCILEPRVGPATNLEARDRSAAEKPCRKVSRENRWAFKAAVPRLCRPYLARVNLVARSVDASHDASTLMYWESVGELEERKRSRERFEHRMRHIRYQLEWERTRRRRAHAETQKHVVDVTVACRPATEAETSSSISVGSVSAHHEREEELEHTCASAGASGPNTAPHNVDDPRDLSGGASDDESDP